MERFRGDRVSTMATRATTRRRLAQGVAALVAALPTAGWARAGAAGAATPVAPAPSDLSEGELVDIGGRKLFARCRGTGTPTVVFDAGYGRDSHTWALVEPTVAGTTRTFTYDRAATGRSTAAAPAQSSGDAIADLHALLQAAAVPPPYVLVGHSYGGQNVRLFASTYPDEVAGLVLVDAFHEDYLDRLRQLDPAQWWTLLGMLAPVSEWVDIVASGDQVRTAGPLPDVPATIIARGATTFPPPEPTAATEALWQELQADLAGRMPRAELIVADRSGHDVPTDRPEVIVGAIRRVLAAARAADSTRLLKLGNDLADGTVSGARP